MAEPSVYDLSKQMTMQDFKQGIMKNKKTGALYKLVDTSKITNRRPAIVFFFDLSLLIMAVMNLILWSAINKLFVNEPFKNSIIMWGIILASKCIVFLFGLIGMIQLYQDKNTMMQIYSTVRLVETFMVGSIKLVYSIGLFRYANQSVGDPSQDEQFKSFVIPMAVFYLFDFIVFISLNIYFCNILWIGIAKAFKFERVKK